MLKIRRRKWSEKEYDDQKKWKDKEKKRKAIKRIIGRLQPISFFFVINIFHSIRKKQKNITKNKRREKEN